MSLHLGGRFGPQRGDRVAFALSNCVEAIEVMSAIRQRCADECQATPASSSSSWRTRRPGVYWMRAPIALVASEGGRIARDPALFVMAMSGPESGETPGFLKTSG